MNDKALGAKKTGLERALTAENSRNSAEKLPRPEEIMYISVKNGGGSLISGRIKAYLEQHGAGSGGAILIEERHKDLVNRAIEAIDRAAVSAAKKSPLDLIAYDVWECAQALGEITGRNVTDDVIDMIFSKFCLGK
jgi:tRNA modification GTPase